MKLLIPMVVCSTLVAACAESATDPGGAGDSDIPWSVVRAGDVAETAPDWSSPVFIEASDTGWEDGPFISLSGVRLYFTYYPEEDLFAAMERGEFIDDLDVVLSHQPFQGKSGYKAYHVSEDFYSEGGLQITSFDDHYYHSNRDFAVDGKSDDDIYKNNERLAFNGDESAQNPHYCTATDELFFDVSNQTLFVYADGAVAELPSPLNATGSASFQPFLSEDCQTMYFTSTREGPSAIYRSERAQGGWSEPEKIVWSRNGVGEPSLPENGERLYFVQVFLSPDGATFTTDLFFVSAN